MPVLLLNTCCCCVSLRTGCLILGYLQLISLIIGESFLLVLMSSMYEDVYHGYVTFPPWIKATTITSFVLVAVLLILAFTVILLIGVHKRKREYVKTYLWYTIIFLTVEIISSPLLILYAEISAEIIVLKLVTIAVNIYISMVVRSYYYNMELQKPATNNSA